MQREKEESGTERMIAADRNGPRKNATGQSKRNIEEGKNLVNSSVAAVVMAGRQNKRR